MDIKNWIKQNKALAAVIGGGGGLLLLSHKGHQSGGAADVGAGTATYDGGPATDQAVTNGGAVQLVPVSAAPSEQSTGFDNNTMDSGSPSTASTLPFTYSIGGDVNSPLTGPATGNAPITVGGDYNPEDNTPGSDTGVPGSRVAVPAPTGKKIRDTTTHHGKRRGTTKHKSPVGHVVRGNDRAADNPPGHPGYTHPHNKTNPSHNAPPMHHGTKHPAAKGPTFNNIPRLEPINTPPRLIPVNDIQHIIPLPKPVHHTTGHKKR